LSIQSVKLRDTKTPRKTSIFVAILTGHERHNWIHPDLLNVCLRMVFWQQNTGSILRHATIHGASPVDAARNIAVTQMLETGVEWILQIDNDVVPPPNVLSILDEIGDRKIVGLPCPFEPEPGNLGLAMGMKRGDVFDPIQIVEGWAQVDAVGSACLLVHRDVFRAVESPWFQCSVRNGSYCNEDFNFCDKARVKGFDVWTHFGFCCKHYKTVNLADYFRPVSR
jgi:hypothetical protein